MELGWYKEIDSKPFGEFHSLATEGKPGYGDKFMDLIQPSMKIKYSTYWDFEEGGGKPETATGGSPEAPKMDEETKAAIEFLTQAGKSITPELVESAKVHLKSKQVKK